MNEDKSSWFDKFCDYKPTIKDWIIAILLGYIIHTLR